MTSWEVILHSHRYYKLDSIQVDIHVKSSQQKVSISNLNCAYVRYGWIGIEKWYLKSYQRQHQSNVIHISSPREKLRKGVIWGAKNIESW